VFVRKLPALIVAAGLMVSLASCASAPSLFDACTPAFTAGENSALVTAEGRFAGDPKADFPTPLVSKSPQVQVVSQGDGKTVNPGDTAVVQITIYDGKTGDSLVSTDYTGAGLMLFATDALPEFGGVAQCVTVGSRVAAVGTAEDLIGQADIDQNQLPLALDDTVVLIVDVTTSYLGKANGVDQFPQAGFPSVVLAPNGQPGFTFPSDTPPDDLKIGVLKAGNGATVKKGDSVVVNYTGLLWGAEDTFDSSWDRGRPASFLAESLDDADGGLVPGFAKALIGQKVGSQVIVVIPPKDGYPAGTAPASIPEGSTMVFVFDVLGIDKQ
jgi:FKBP-type peptidyl-prolyl cis-trans isomerase